MLRHDCGCTQGAPQRERTHIPHEYLGRISVIPEKSHTSPYDSATEHSQLSASGHILNLKIVGDLDVSRDVRQDHVGGCRHDHRADGKAIQAIGQVDGIGGAYDDQCSKENVTPSQIGVDPLEKWNAHMRVKIRPGVKKSPHNQPNEHLRQQLGPPPQPLAMFFPLHQVVVHKSDGTITDGDKEHDPDKEIGQVTPKQGGRNNGKQDQQPPHRGGTRFCCVSGRALIPHVLAHAVLRQFSYHPRPKEQAYQ